MKELCTYEKLESPEDSVSAVLECLATKLGDKTDNAAANTIRARMVFLDESDEPTAKLLGLDMIVECFDKFEHESVRKEQVDGANHKLNKESLESAYVSHVATLVK